MKQLLAVLIFANAAVFVIGALLHAGLAMGPLHEALIVPATIVELICALALIWGGTAVLRGSPNGWRAALAGNLVAIAGVATGMFALANGAAPRTASDNLDHSIMLALAAASLVILFIPAGRAALGRAK